MSIIPFPAAQQGTDEWRQARCGWVTASRMSDMLAQIKSGGYGATRDRYRMEKIVERLTNEPQDNGFTSVAMQKGIDTEPEARAAYAFMNDSKVEECGFIPHPTIPWLGCSPDGLINDDGVLEIKCPEGPQHWRTIRYDEIKGEYQWQIQTALACCQRKWADFVSYNPVFPTNRRLKVIRVARDEKMIAKIEDETRKFLAEIAAEVEWAQRSA